MGGLSLGGMSQCCLTCTYHKIRRDHALFHGTMAVYVPEFAGSGDICIRAGMHQVVVDLFIPDPIFHHATTNYLSSCNKHIRTQQNINIVTKERSFRQDSQRQFVSSEAKVSNCILI